MSKIILADDGITFDGDTLSKRPLGGAETAFISHLTQTKRMED